MRSIFVIALVALTAPGCGSAQGQSQAAEADAHEIAQRLAAYDRANNAGDLEALMTIFAEDAVMMAPDQPPIVGKAAIREVIRGWLSGRCTSRHEPIATESFGEIVIHRGNGTGSCAGSGSSGPATYNNKYLHVYRRQPDGALRYWRGAFSSNAPPS